MDGALGLVPLVLAHGFKVLPPPKLGVLDTDVEGIILAPGDSTTGVGTGEIGRSGDAQALISSLLLSSPPPPGPPPSPGGPPPKDSLLRSLATPPYASCTTDNAADAFDENRPHIDLTPLEENKSDEAALGEGGGLELNLLTRGEGERGMEDDPADGDVYGLSYPSKLSCLDLDVGVGRE